MAWGPFSWWDRIEGSRRRRDARRVGDERARIDRQRLADLLDEPAEMRRLQQVETAGAVLGRVAPAVLRVADEDPLRLALASSGSEVSVSTSSTMPGSSSPVFEPSICGTKTLRLKSSSFSSRIPTKITFFARVCCRCVSQAIISRPCSP
jgi:hypothetical protein